MTVEVITADSLEWLPKHRNLGTIFASIADMDEVKMNERDYIVWFTEIAKECFLSASKTHPVLFYQTDRLLNGRRISKPFILMSVALSLGYELVWHKIVLRREIGKIDLYRAGFSHLLCFADSSLKCGKASPDVMYSGRFLHPYGVGMNAAKFALRFALNYGKSVCDPFCGHGTIPAVARMLGFEKIIAVDIDPKQTAETSRLMRVMDQNS